jgi:peptide chain release factor subunit 1
VTASLTNALTAARSLKTTPENGVAIFASPEQRFVLVPPSPLSTNVYKCGKTFELQELEDMLASKEVIALIVMDRKECTLGWLKGKAVVEGPNFDSQVQSKTCKGGSSSNRYARIVEEQAHAFFVKIGEVASREFEGAKIIGVAVGGPGSTKDEWLRGEFLDYRLRKLVMPSFDVGYTNEYGLYELARRVGERMPSLERARETAILERFFDGIHTGKSIYGVKESNQAVDEGRAEIILVVEDPESYEEDNVQVVVISDESDMGKQFHKMGGIGAILRW